MKKILKWIGIVILSLIVIAFIAVMLMSESLPQGETGPKAEALTEKILNRLNITAWDSLNYMQWTFFRGEHHYHWDKKNNIAIIEWDENKVIMDLNKIDGNVYQSGQLISSEEKKEIIQKAWSYWCNDSFWLYAPYKLKDKGIVRSIVEKDGKQGLLITYNSGGTTPGDSYLWWVDDTGLPTSFQMWVSILPIKGIEASWDQWKEISGGSLISTHHKMGPLDMSLSEVKGGGQIESIGLKKGAFQLN